MGLWSRLLMLLHIRAERAMDRVEDPRDTLEYSYQRQIELLQEMRRAVADAVTSRKRIELQGAQLEKSAERLRDQARQALTQDREDLARQALSRRAAIATEIEDLKSQRDQMLESEGKLVEQAARLEAQVAAFRRHKETMKATYTAAQARARVQEATTGLSDETKELMLAMQRATDKIEQTQARAAALEELTDSGAIEDLSQDRLQAQLDVHEQSALVERELKELKSAAPKPALPAAKPRRTPRPKP